MDTVETKDEEETQQQHEAEDGRQTQNAELQQKEAEETKTQEEEEKDKQDKEQLRPEDGEKKRLEEESKRKEQDLRQEKDNETNNEGKDMEENEEDNVQKGEGNYKGEGNVDVDRKQSDHAVQDFEHPPQTLQDFEQSPKTVQESKHSAKTTKDSEQPGQIVQDIEQRNVKKNTTCDGRRSTDSAKVSGRNATKLSSTGSCVMNAQKDWGDYLPEPIDNKRLAWIKDCLPWSKIAGVLNMRQGRGSSKRPPRRPASANTLPPLTEVRLLSATGATSLQKITTVQLQDLPGCSLSTLSYCGHLKALALNNCGLVTVEGLEPCTELTYLDLQNNKIEMISPLKASVGLTYVDLSHNCLSMIHGLEECTNIRYLDLSHNRITRIGGLGDLRRLHTLWLCHNQLISSHGIGELVALQNVDLSNNLLPRLDDMQHLALLQVLNAASNNLLQVSDFLNAASNNLLQVSHFLSATSHNLLQVNHFLNATSNNLLQISHFLGSASNNLLQVNHFLGVTSNSLLQVPQLSNHVLLQQFLLHDNSISSIRNIAQGWCPLLQHLDLSKNSVSFLADLASCMLLETFDLKDNQVSDLPSLLTALSTTRTIETLDLTGCPVCQEANYRTVILQVLPTLCTLDGTTVSPCWKHPDRTEFEEMCLSQIQQESSLRNSHEAALGQCTSVIEKSQVHKRYFDRSFQLAVKHRQSHEYGEVTVDPSTTFDLNPTAVQPKKVVSQTANMKALFDEAVRKTTQESSMPNVPRPPSGGRPKELASRPQSHLLVEKTMSTPVDSCKKNFTREEKAAVKIQALWRVHNLRHKIDYYTRMSAAMSIQACWRGYYLRKRLHQAMDYARFGDDDSESVYGEVNMDDFDFSEADLDKGWTPPETPQLPQNHAVLRPPPSSNPTPVPAVPPLFMHCPFPPDQPKQAWRNADSPFSQTGYRPGARVPLAPLSAPSETCMTQRTALSKKEEQITEEWGFKDGRTAELMLQRAKKLKYNVAKRKKLSKLDPQQRLAMLRKLEQPQPVQPPTRRAVPRTEYFKGRVQVEEKRAKQEFAEKRHRMFEWLHTQVGNFDITSSRINKHLNTGSHDKPESSHNLPQLDPGVIAGGKAQFMGSPRSLEMQSLCEGASGETPQPPTAQRRLSMQDDYSRGRLPQIKTTSAPVMRVKEKMSWRNKNNARTSGGWGGGRKRTKPS
ncbi:hypothetical protein LSAT2_025443 [Lamellibrachia satsuma]|nr:hypothetical protein LSAT2_025443 [Lamellibrachia satsuma]